MNMLVPDVAIIEIPGTNMRLIVAQDEFGCVSLTLGMRQQKTSRDISLTNAALEPGMREILRKNFSFRVGEATSSRTLESLTSLGLVQAVHLRDFDGQKLYSLAGAAYSKWEKLVSLNLQTEFEEKLDAFVAPSM